VQGNMQDPDGHRAIAGVVRQEHGGRKAVLRVLKNILNPQILKKVSVLDALHLKEGSFSEVLKKD